VKQKGKSSYSQTLKATNQLTPKYKGWVSQKGLSTFPAKIWHNI